MSRCFLLLTLLAAVLSACAQGSHDPAKQLDAGLEPPIEAGSFELALPKPAPPADPRTASLAASYLVGTECIASSGRSTPNGDELELWAMDDGLEWALYEFAGAPADAVYSIGYVVRDRAAMFTDVILALSDYQNNRWKFLEPQAEDAYDFLIDAAPGRYTNSMGNTYLAVLAWDQAQFDIRSVNIEFSNRNDLKGDWYTRGHDNQRTHRSEKHVVENFDMAWRTYEPVGYVDGSPCFAYDDTIYITTYAIDNLGYLYAFHRFGLVKWSHQGLSDLRSSPAVSASGTVFFGDQWKNLNKVNALGQRVNLIQGDREILGSPLIDDDRMVVYFGDNGGTLYCFDLFGVQQWALDLEAGIAGVPALDLDGNVYVGNSQGILSKVSPAGELLWDYDGEGKANGCVCVTDDSIVYATMDGFIYSISPDGDLIGSYNAGGEFYASPALSSAGVIYIGNTDGNLYLFDTSATHIDTYDAGSPIKTSAAIDGDGTVFFGTFSGRLIALNPDLTIQWEFQAIDELRASPAIGNEGELIVPCFDGTLYCFYPNAATFPSAPDNFSASDGTHPDRIQLTWDEAFDIDGYYIYRDGGSEPIATVGFVQSWMDEDIGDTDPHTYDLVAFNAFAESNPVSDTGFAAETSYQAPWAMTRGNSSRTNTSPFPGPQVRPDVTYDDRNPIQCSPVSIDASGNYYIIFGTWLYCYAPDGTENWKYATDDNTWITPVLGANGSVLITRLNGTFQSISPTGSLEWTYAPEEMSSIYPAAVADDGTIIAMCYDAAGDYAHAVTPGGEFIWSYETDHDHRYLHPAIGSDGTVYVANYQDRLIALNSDGSLKWQDIGNSMYCIPVVLRDAVSGDKILAGDGSTTNCYDSEGDILWTVAKGGYRSVTPGGLLYICNSHWVYQYDTSGNFIDELVVDSFQQADNSVCDINGNIYVMESGANVICLDSNLDELWSYHTLATSSDAELAIAPDGRLFFNDSNGTLVIMAEPSS